jgi:FRG domain
VSLGGQWTTRYSGSNTGTLVVDIDEVGDHYEGTGITWDDAPRPPKSLVRIRTTSKETSQRLQNVPVVPIDNRGNVVPSEVIERLRIAEGIMFPATADVEIDLKGESLEVRWRTPIGTFGSGIACASKTRANLRSELEPSRISSWDKFKGYVNRLERNRFVFRGQESSEWRLRTSFHRTGRADLERYQAKDINTDVNKLISGFMQPIFDLRNPQHFLSILHLAQHHGYPTPLLDWTWSPYVAAFFAFRNIKPGKLNRSRKNVRVVKLDTWEWSSLPKADKIFPYSPHVTLLDPLAFANNRAIPQQSYSTLSNVDDIETHIQSVERNLGKKFLEVFDFPIRERDHIMQELALMGVTAGSLLPGLDGAFESLRERNFS